MPGPYVQLAIYAPLAHDPAALRARLFDPLAGDQAAVQLGLGAVYGTIAAHRGALAVYGGVEGGVVVKLYLPLVRDGALGALDASAGPLRGFGPVLVADDEPLVVDALRHVLVGLGYTVTVARDGDEALAKVRETARPFVAIICDMMMPKQHGAVLLRELAALAPGTPLIVSSGFIRDRELAVLSELGVTAFLPKPVRRAELAAVLAAAQRSAIQAEAHALE